MRDKRSSHVKRARELLWKSGKGGGGPKMTCHMGKKVRRWRTCSLIRKDEKRQTNETKVCGQLYRAPTTATITIDRTCPIRPGGGGGWVCEVDWRPLTSNFGHELADWLWVTIHNTCFVQAGRNKATRFLMCEQRFAARDPKVLIDENLVGKAGNRRPKPAPEWREWGEVMNNGRGQCGLENNFQQSSREQKVNEANDWRKLPDHIFLSFCSPYSCAGITLGTFKVGYGKDNNNNNGQLLDQVEGRPSWLSVVTYIKM